MKKKQSELNNDQGQHDENKVEVLAFESLIPVVGIGASAGGIEGLETLLKSLPENLGLAYIVIQHLSAKDDSILAHVLQRHTVMTVNEVTDHMAIRPNNVYVIPAN